MKYLYIIRVSYNILSIADDESIDDYLADGIFYIYYIGFHFVSVCFSCLRDVSENYLIYTYYTEKSTVRIYLTGGVNTLYTLYNIHFIWIMGNLFFSFLYASTHAPSCTLHQPHPFTIDRRPSSYKRNCWPFREQFAVHIV